MTIVLIIAVVLLLIGPLKRNALTGCATIVAIIPAIIGMVVFLNIADGRGAPIGMVVVFALVLALEGYVIFADAISGITGPPKNQKNGQQFRERD
jgi:hypothetical protein